MMPATIEREIQNRNDRAQRAARNQHVDLRAVEPGSNGSSHAEQETTEAQWPELDDVALHGLAGDVVAMIGPQTEADPPSIVVQFLALFGNAIGRSAYFSVEGSRHHTNIFVLIVGATAKGRKGTSLTYPQRIFERVDEQHALECTLTGISSGEGVIAAVRDPTEEKQAVKERGGKVVDYQVVTTDQGVTDKRAMIIESEFASVIARMGRDGSSTSAVLRQAWDGARRLKVMTRNNPVTATDAHISIIGHITKDELLRNLDATEKANGFANRFLFVCSKRSKCLPLGGHIPESGINALVMEAKRAVDHARDVREMTFNKEARALWFEVYPALSAGRAGMLGVVTSRSEAYVLRLSCLYALLDCSREIELIHLQAALALWSYCEDSARYVFGDALGDRFSDEIAAALRGAGADGLTRSQIRDVFNRNVERDRLNTALRLLSENGLAFYRKEKGEANKPIERWFWTHGNEHLKEMVHG